MSVAFHPVYRTLNRPLTWLGADRRFTMLAFTIGAGGWNAFNSLRAGVLLFLVIYSLGRWATRDLQLLRIVINSGRYQLRYDPHKIAAGTGPRIVRDA